MREPSTTSATRLKSTITCDMEGRLETFNAGAEAIFGRRFKVVGFVKGPWFEAIGFADGDRSHRL